MDETVKSKREILSKAANGIKTVQDFALFMRGVMSAVAGGELDARTANAICQSALVMLKAIKMQIEGAGTSQEAIPIFPAYSTKAISDGAKTTAKAEAQ